MPGGKSLTSRRLFSLCPHTEVICLWRPNADGGQSARSATTGFARLARRAGVHCRAGSLEIFDELGANAVPLLTSLADDVVGAVWHTCSRVWDVIARLRAARPALLPLLFAQWFPASHMVPFCHLWATIRGGAPSRWRQFFDPSHKVEGRRCHGRFSVNF